MAGADRRFYRGVDDRQAGISNFQPGICFYYHFRAVLCAGGDPHAKIANPRQQCDHGLLQFAGVLGSCAGSSAIFFFQMLGIAIAPTILGLVQNSAPDLESGLKRVFLVGAIAVLISLILILTIPEIPVDREAS